MLETRQSVERRLSKKRKLLAILEEQIAGYTELEAPVSKLAERDQLREEITRLEALLESGELPEINEGATSERAKANTVIHISDVSGKVAVGRGHVQADKINGQAVAVGGGIAQISIAQPRLTEADQTELRQALTDLKARVAAEAPPEKKNAALERVEELEEAITAEEPDLATMEYVQSWFAKNLPGLAEAVTGVVVHPIVGKLAEAAGDALAAEFRRRFGGE